MSETDPNGKGQHEAGAKLDCGKVRLGLVLGGFARALSAVGEVGTFGAAKYTDNGWLHVASGEARYTDAMLRHHFAECEGEFVDGDSGLLHAAHRAWNALAVLELKLSQATQANQASQAKAEIQGKPPMSLQLSSTLDLIGKEWLSVFTWRNRAANFLTIPQEAAMALVNDAIDLGHVQTRERLGELHCRKPVPVEVEAIA